MPLQELETERNAVVGEEAMENVVYRLSNEAAVPGYFRFRVNP